MTIKQLRRVQQTKPFVPYTFPLADGTTVPVPYPDYLLPHPTAGRTLAIAAKNGTFHIVDLLLAAAIEVGNGDARRRRNGR